MKTTNKVTAKLNNNVRKALAAAAIQANAITQFDHFSYQADWSNFPNSLLITCHPHQDQWPLDTTVIEAKLSKLLQLCLLKQGIKFRDFRKNIILSDNSKRFT
jgi:hypothetical protein